MWKGISRKKYLLSMAPIAVFALVGTTILLLTHAATPVASVEAENGTLSGATKVADASASGGNAIHFASSGGGGASCQSAPYTAGGTDPWGGCFPGDFNTGYPHGLAGDTRPSVTLTAYTGSNTITTDGTTIDSKLITGGLTIRAHNVTITRSKIVGVVDVGYNSDNYGPITFTDVEIDGNSNGQDAGLGNAHFTCTRCNVHDARSSIKFDGNITVQDSWLHGNYYISGAHMSGLSTNGGAHATAIHNMLDCDSPGDANGGCSSDSSLYGDFAQVDDIVYQHNLFAGNVDSGYCFYGGSVSSKPYPHATNVRITNNVWQRGASGKGCEFGPVDSWEYNTGNVWSGNTWDDGTALVM